MKTAGALGVKCLYHYEAFHPAWLEGTLGGRLYFPDPSKFNDPWDCRPCFDISSLNDPVVYEKHVAWFDRVGRRWTPTLTDDDHRRRIERIRKDRTYLESLVTEFNGGISGEIHKRYRVYCLAGESINALIWSHYADHHRGICLEFATNNAVFTGALPIEYCAGYPLLDLTDDTISSGLSPLLTKSSVWGYEKEYRLIAQEEAAALPHDTLITRNQVLIRPALPSNALKAVIMGCMMPDATRDQIRELIRRSGRTGVTLKKAVRSPNRYELAIEPDT